MKIREITENQHAKGRNGQSSAIPGNAPDPVERRKKAIKRRVEAIIANEDNRSSLPK